MKEDDNVLSVLADDGLDKSSLVNFSSYENRSSVSLSDLRESLGMGSWAVRVAYNSRFGGVVIQQQTGEGNRKHYHPDSDEKWVILDGEWEWWIDGQGTTRVSKNDIVVVPANTWHHIKCVSGPGARYAITKPDVNHIYSK